MSNLTKHSAFMYVVFTWCCYSLSSTALASQLVFNQNINTAQIERLYFYLETRSRPQIKNKLTELGFERTIKKRKNGTIGTVDETTSLNDCYSLSDFINQHKDPQGHTIAHYACDMSNIALLKILMDINVSMKSPNKQNQTPIYYAKTQEAIEILLHSNESFLSHQDDSGHSPLNSHIIKNNLDAVTSIMYKMSKSPRQHNPSEPHPLSFVQSLEMAKVLKKYYKALPPLPTEVFTLAPELKEAETYFWAIINTQPNINIQNAFHENLLHIATKKNFHDIVKSLLNKNINIHAQTSQGLTALHIATLYGHTEIVATLIEHVKTLEFQGFTHAKTTLLEQENIDGETALMTATKANHTSVAEQLIAADANIFQCNENQHSLLHFTKDPNLAEKLIGSGLSVKARGILGHTPLHFVKSVGMAQLLINNEADVNAETTDGDTPLHLIKNADITTILLNNDANVNSQNNKNKTPLHYAIQHNNIMKYKVLMAHHADTQAIDIYRKTPSDYLNYNEVPYACFVFEELETLLTNVKKASEETQFAMDNI